MIDDIIDFARDVWVVVVGACAAVIMVSAAIAVVASLVEYLCR